MSNKKSTYSQLEKRVNELEFLLENKIDNELVDKKSKINRENDELLKESQRIAKIGSWNLDLVAEKLYWSDQCYNLFDKTNEFTPSFDEFARLVHPADSKNMRKKFNSALQSDKKPYHVIVRIVNDSKREWIMEAFGAIHRDKNGKAIRIGGTAQDVTERKWTEEVKQKNEKLLITKKKAEEDEKRLKFVLEGSKLGYWDWNIENNQVQRNERWAEMLGYTIEEIEFTVNQWTDLIHPNDRETALTSLNNHLNGITPHHQVEYRMLTKDKQWRWIFDTAKVVKKDSNGKPLRMSGTHTDITERKLYEERIHRYAEELQELNATKDKFFSIIAHDLRAPFNTILGFSKLLVSNGKTYSKNNISQISETLHTAADQALKLLNNLLDWSQLQNGKIKPVLTEISPESGIDDIMLLCTPIAKNKNIHLKTKINIKDKVFADINMLNTILRNLVSNAIKYTEPKGVVTIETKDQNGKIIFSVTDTGVGIEDEHLHNLFKIENKLSKNGTANEEGTGLGLILCKEFVNKLNGDIWVESEYGKGSKFHFTIPKYTTLEKINH